MPVIVFTSFYYLCTGRSLLALRALFTLHTNYTNTLMHRGQLRGQCPAQGYFSTQTGGARDLTTAPPVYSLTDFSGRTLFSLMILRQHM